MLRFARPIVAALLTMWIAAALPAPIEGSASAQPPNGDRGDQQDRRGRRGAGRDRERSDRPAEPRAAEPKPAAESSTSFGTLSDDAKFAKSASDKIKANDANGNGILEGDELAKLGMSRRADGDGDGKITQPELVAYYRGLSQPAPADSATASSATAKPAATPTDTAKTDAKKIDSRKLVNTQRKSYRFKTTKERLPTWQFASRDTNGDGQVSMSEYARVWSDRTAAEFQRYDRDNDGMITAKEAR